MRKSIAQEFIHTLSLIYINKDLLMAHFTIQEYGIFLFYHWFKYDITNGQLNPAGIYSCSIPGINKDLLMAYLGHKNTFLFYH